ncbi:MAG: NTP transferase domain-containing protein [Phycisphaerales bacterium]|nr:NTP transferase domain-containing protein [Phycisphaerales bacterium]
MSVAAVILAAGRSTRMKSNKPKVLHEVCGRSMLEHVLQACWEAGCARVIVVVGHGKEAVMSALSDERRIIWVEQTEQLGTGHAVKVCEPELRKLQGDVFVLAGDGPMIRGEVLRRLLAAHRQDHADASMATAVLDDPFGYGRVIRDEEGNFLEIVEQADATAEQAAVKEAFPSYYCFRVEALLSALDRLENKNRKGEYYLTDTYGILRRMGRKITAVQAVAPDDVLAANSREQLAEVDAAMQRRIQKQVREGGVTIVNGDQTYIEAGVTVGMDTVIHPFSYIGRDSAIGAECVIGPFAFVPRNSIVPEGTTLSGNLGAALAAELQR